LASFNLLLQLAPRDDLPRYSATLQSTGMVAAFAGPLAGSALVALGGIPLVFIISAAGRAAALALFVAPTRPWPRRAPEVAEPAEGAGIPWFSSVIARASLNGRHCDVDDRVHAYRDRKSTRLNSSHVKISYAV